MAWTPYVGTPAKQVGEGQDSVVGSDRLAVANYHPSSRMSRMEHMTSAQRLATSLAGPIPWQQLTPDQQWFIDNNANGRWANDAHAIAQQPAVQVTRHPDGTTDMSPLHLHAGFHVDLGGRGARDFGARRP